MPEKEILSENLRKYRKLHHCSQMEFAFECGISVEILSLIERNESNPTLATLQKLAAYTGKTVSELLYIHMKGGS